MPRDAVDTRDLPPVATRSQLRYDALLGEWVAIASHRQTPHLPAAGRPVPALTRPAPGRATEIPESDYQVVVFENRFPSLATGVDRDVPPTAPGDPLAELRPGFGRCEVVCFTSEHDRVVRRARARARPAGGRRLGRPHRGAVRAGRRGAGLLLREPRRGDRGDALPPARPDLRLSVRDPAGREGAGVGPPAPGGHRRRPVRRGRSTAERSGPRVVAANEHWTAFVPAAARWPYEVQLFPTRQVPDIPALDDAERDAFVEVYLDVLGRFARRFEHPDALHRRVEPGAGRATGREDWWLHLQLFSLLRAPGKLKYLAGSESGMGAFITDTNPEDVAEQLRGRGGAVSPTPSGPRGGLRRAVRHRARGRLGGARPGERHRRAHRLQRRLRAARGAAAHHPGRGRPAHRRPGGVRLAAGRRRRRRARRRRAGPRPTPRAGRAIRPAWSTGSRDRLAGRREHPGRHRRARRAPACRRRPR